MKDKQSINAEFDEIVLLHINGEDTRFQFSRDARSFIISKLTEQLEGLEKEVNLCIESVYHSDDAYSMLEDIKKKIQERLQALR